MKLLVILLLGALLTGCDQKQTPTTGRFIPDIQPAQSAGSAQRDGRYVIVFGPHARADTFLLDTQKGKVWQLTKYTDLDGEPTLWDDMGIVDNSSEMAERIPGSVTTFELFKLYPKKDGKKK